MDELNRQILNDSGAKAKLLLDANVFSYVEAAYQATGHHLLDYLDTIAGIVDWFVGSRVAVNLFNTGTLPGILVNILNCDYPDVKMDSFPYIKKDGSVSFVTLNKIAPDDWGQIVLAYNHEDLLLVTNDSKMFKTAHAVTEGRAIAFHDFIEKISPYWDDDEGWRELSAWFKENVGPVRNNSSWVLPSDAKVHAKDE